MLDRSGNPSAASPAPADHDTGTVAMMARARRLMVISALTTALTIAAVLGVIGYRIFHAGRSAGATGTAGDRIVVTIELAGTTEIRTFDAATLEETGRLRFATEP